MSTTQGASPQARSSGYTVISVCDVLCALQLSGASKLSDVTDKNCRAIKWITVLHFLHRKHVQKSFRRASTKEGGAQTGDSSPKLGQSISLSSPLDETVPQPLSKAMTTNFLYTWLHLPSPNLMYGILPIQLVATPWGTQ